MPRPRVIGDRALRCGIAGNNLGHDALNTLRDRGNGLVVAVVVLRSVRVLGHSAFISVVPIIPVYVPQRRPSVSLPTAANCSGEYLHSSEGGSSTASFSSSDIAR